MDSLPAGPAGGFRSLTTRLIVWTLVAVGGVYGMTLVVSNTLGRRAALVAAEREAESEAQGVTGHVEDELHAVEERTLVLAKAVETLQPDRDGLDRLLQRFVPGDSRVFGAAVAFEPGAGYGGSEREAFYYYRLLDGSGGLGTADLARDGYRYWEKSWFTEPLRTGQPGWTEPYRDVGGSGVAMVTFSVPLHGPDGLVRGVVTADVRLRWLDALLGDAEMGRASLALMVSRAQHIVAASDRRAEHAIETTEGVLDALDPRIRDRFQPIVDRMVAGHSGFEPMELEGQRLRLLYRPVGRAGWALCLLYRESELFEEVNRFRTIQAALSIGGVFLLAAVVVVVSRSVTRPLGALAASARQMATGDLDVELPSLRTRDEVGTLTQAFHNLQRSLKIHIRDLQETTAAKERLEGELKVARRIQADMLPRAIAGGPGEGFELAAALSPARAVGGDLFTYFQTGSHLFFLVGDVSGKGVPAALFMARTKTLFEALAAREADPGAVLALANRNLCTENEAGMFVTAVCGVLDVATGDLAFALAGHEPPVFVPGEGDPRPLVAEGGRVLGLIEDSDYPVNRLRLANRETIVLYTDGVSEAQDTEDRFFGVERIVRALSGHRHEEARGVTRGLLSAVREFAGAAPQSDDITLLTLRFLAPGS